jgi:uncharacterized protein with FMN-binding domain
MKRVLLAITGTVAGLIALLSFKTHAPVGAAVGALPATTPAPSASTAAPQNTTSAPPRAGSSSATKNRAKATAKTYLGQAVQTQYGVVQVKVTVTGSHINSVQLAQLTAYDSRSQEINSYAEPILVDETMSAQNAQINTVSGATYTSDGYLQSLQSALDQAGIK